MNHIKSENIRRTTFFTTAILSSITIQLMAQNSYPAFEDRAIEFYEQQVEDSQAID